MSNKLGMRLLLTSRSDELFFGCRDRLLQISLDVVINRLFLTNLLQHFRVAGVEELIQHLLEGPAFGNFKIVQKTVCTGVNDDDLLFYGQWRVLILLQNLREPLASG